MSPLSGLESTTLFKEVHMATITIEEQGVQLLHKLYSYGIKGLPNQKTVQELAAEYLERYETPSAAADKFVKNQILLCTTNGFLLNLGGLITLPVTIPANISSVLYIQMRMIATLAYMGGFDVYDNHVETLCFVALTGKGASDILKQVGVSFGTRLTRNMIAKISGKTLTKINQKVGMRLITKFGEKGIVNLGKAVPVVGGAIGGGFDFATTKVIADTSIKMFNL